MTVVDKCQKKKKQRIFHFAAKTTKRRPIVFVWGDSLESPIVHYGGCVSVAAEL